MHSWLRENWIAVLVLTALVASPIYAHADAQTQAASEANAVRQLNVTRCVRSAPRAAYEIAFQYAAGQARRAAGNIVTAERYDALANAGIETVAAPKGYEGQRALVQVTYTRLPGKKIKLTADLTPFAKKLQREGCEQAYAR